MVSEAVNAVRVFGVLASWPLAAMQCRLVRHHVTVVLPDGTVICRRCSRDC